MPDDREYVQLHRDMFLKLQKNAQAAKQLNTLLKEKEEDLKWYKEKATQYEKEVSRLDDRLSSVMKFQLSTSTDSINQNSVQKSTPLYSDRVNESSTCSSSMGFPRGFTLPGVSKTMFDNVVRDNIKMKKLLQDALKRDGRELKSMLESKEYEEIIKQLRMKITQKEQEIAQLITLHAGDDQCALINKLQTKIQTLEKALATKQILIESLNHEVDDIKTQSSIKYREVYKSSESGFDTIPSGEKLSQESGHMAQVDDTDGKPEETDDMKLLKEEHQKAITNFQNTISYLQTDVARERSEKEKKETECKEYAASFEELRVSRRQAEMKESETRNECEGLKKELEACKTEMNQHIEKCNHMEAQMVVYREDYQTEAKEKEIMRKRFEEDVSRQQIHIRKLSIECEKLNKLLTEEKKKAKVMPVSVQSAFCGSAETLPWKGTRMLPAYGLVYDGEATDSPVEFTCPRCGEKFNNCTTFQEHTGKCTKSTEDSA